MSVHLAELLAALAGSWYVLVKGNVKKTIRWFTFFLWLTLLIDVTGLYAVYAYFTDYENLEFLRNSPFRRNEWYFNLFNIFFLLVYIAFFIVQLRSTPTRKLFWFLAGFYLVTEIINLIFSDVFFVSISTYGSITGTLILVLCILGYYYEMLRSSRILYFYKDPAFYISVGVLIRYLVVTPLYIYSKYFRLTSPEFVEVHGLVMSIANLFMYGMFVIGFIACAGSSLKVTTTNTVESR